jgi:dinuclear metal center YbgI/SA1388 family protein
MTVEELYRFLEDKFPRALSAEWDNDGLCCAPSPAKEVKRVLVALDPTAAVVEQAVRGGYDVLLTHHPLLFRGIKALVPTHAVPAKLLRLACAGVSAMSFHTRLDAVSGGVNDILAAKLGLAHVQPFAPEGEVPCGRVGVLKAPMDANAFAQLAKDALGAPAVLLAGEGTVQKIAVCGGEGGDFVEAAKAAGADLFLSGRIGYHSMLDAPEEGLAMIEAGHYATEFPVTKFFSNLLLKIDPKLTVEIVGSYVLRTI